MYYRAFNDTSLAAYATGESNIAGSLLVGADQPSGIEFVANISSASNPLITAAGDEANRALAIAGKGTGALIVGNSSSPVQFGQTFTVQFTPAVLNASTSVQSTVTVTGLQAGRPLLFTPTTPGLSMAYAFRVQCSTANELRFTQQNLTASTIGTGESTARGILIQL